MIFLPHFTRSLLARVLVTWPCLRTAVALGKGMVEANAGLPPSHPLELTPPAALMVIGFVAGAVLVDARRRNEDRFLLCLGYGRLELLGLLIVPLLLLEMVVGVAVRR